MTEIARDILPPSPWERDYWETWSETLPVPQGRVFDAKSMRKLEHEQELAEKARRRNDNVRLATGRVNGKFVQNGSKRS